MLFIINITILLLAGLGMAVPQPGCAIPSDLFEWFNNDCSGPVKDQSHSCFRRDIPLNYKTKSVKVVNGLGCWTGFSDFDGHSCIGRNYGRELQNFCMKVNQPRPDGSVLKCLRWEEKC